jgi:hypothetical protein
MLLNEFLKAQFWDPIWVGTPRCGIRSAQRADPSNLQNLLRKCFEAVEQILLAGNPDDLVP